MPRQLSPATIAQLEAGQVALAMFLQIGFRSETVYCSTLPANFSWGGHTWLGTGSMGKVSTIEEGTSLEARGITVSMSGIDQSLLAESLTDVRLGAPAKLFLGIFTLDPVALIDTPIQLFSGVVDQPSIALNPEDSTYTITLALESALIRLQRACNLMFTPADQKIDYPDDTGLDQVNLLNWQALKWGA